MQNLAKGWKQPPVVTFCNRWFFTVHLLCACDYESLKHPIKMFSSWILLHIYFLIIFINHGYRAAILKKKILWLLPFYMAVTTYFYYEKVRRTMRSATVSNLLKVVLKTFKRIIYIVFMVSFIFNWFFKAFLLNWSKHLRTEFWL